MDADFTKAMLESTKATILLYQTAIDALVVGKVSSYELDTGQTRTRVTKLDLGKMQDAIDSLMNRCATLEARLNGGAVIVGPAY